MRKFVLLCISLCYLWAAYGQDVIRYSYDNAGNRIKREIALSRAILLSSPVRTAGTTLFTTVIIP